MSDKTEELRSLLDEWLRRAEAAEKERDELRAKLDELTPTDPTLCPTCGCHEREWVEGCQCPDRSCGCWEVRQETDQ